MVETTKRIRYFRENLAMMHTSCSRVVKFPPLLMTGTEISAQPDESRRKNVVALAAGGNYKEVIIVLRPESHT